MSDTPYEKCRGMNKDGRCRAGTRHLTHKHSWLGGWYGQIPVRKPPKLQKHPNGPQKKRWWQ